ncbi:MAG: hypothetical protein MUO72_18925 [Bacteroidales bacterium]|nr:hypothetical protein [Bacteroidales bacterium]
MNRIIIRNILLFTALILLLLLVVFFRGRSPFGKRNSSFAASPKEEITKIELSAGGTKLFLVKEGENWLVNGADASRKSSILFIIRILTEMKIKSPVSPELFSKEISEKRIAPVKVRVFERNKVIKSFLVYKTGSNVYGNMMKMREGSKPFIVYVPGFEGDIGSGFTMHELFWQPFTVFNLLPSEISSIIFENVGDTSSSFSISIKGQKYFFSDLNSTLSGWDSLRVKRYISYFTFVQFERWEFDISDEEKKKIESENPLFRITVSKISGEKTVLTLWEKHTGENGVADSDRLLAKTEARDEFFVMRYFDIDPLLKKRSYFFPE